MTGLAPEPYNGYEWVPRIDGSYMYVHRPSEAAQLSGAEGMVGSGEYDKIRKSSHDVETRCRALFVAGLRKEPSLCDEMLCRQQIAIRVTFKRRADGLDIHSRYCSVHGECWTKKPMRNREWTWKVSISN